MAFVNSAMAASYCFCSASSIPRLLYPPASPAGARFAEVLSVCAIHKNVAIASVIVCLFKVFISPPKLLFERLIVYKRGNSRAKDSHRTMKQSPEIEMIDLGGRTNLSKGYAAVFATVVIWSMPSLFQYYLNRYYDPWAQNFYRYSVACIAIAPFVFYRLGRSGPRLNWRALMLCLVPCFPNVVHQITQVMALFYMGPGVYAIFTRSSVIFTALLALAFFPEERYVIRQWQFQAGAVLGLIGAFGVIWFQSSGQDRHIALPGLIIAFTATFCWALYGVLVKRPSAQL